MASQCPAFAAVLVHLVWVHAVWHALGSTELGVAMCSQTAYTHSWRHVRRLMLQFYLLPTALFRFTATPMPGGMYDFAAVSPPGSSVVLTFGGVDSGTGRHRDGIDLYDR